MRLGRLLASLTAHRNIETVGAFPLKYLGVPLHYDKLSREDLQPLVDKLLLRIAGWRGKLLSLAARALLVKTCLTSIPIYLFG